MALSPLTPEQRAAALEKAAQVRARRAEVKKLLKQGTTSLADVLYAEDDAIAKMKVLAVVQSMPGVGKVKAGQIMERCSIDPSRRVRGLGSVQRAALEDEFAAA
jgi:predicted dinucleotide-binding enzyme